MNATSMDSDGDGHGDKVEYYCYWQYKADHTGIQCSCGAQISPIVSHSGSGHYYSYEPTSIEMNDATTAISNFADKNAVYPTGTGLTFLQAGLWEDNIYSWFWAWGTNYLNVYYQGWSAPYWLSNATMRSVLSDVKIVYRLMPYTTARSNQALSDWYFTVKTSASSSYTVTLVSGPLTYGQKNVWYDDVTSVPSQVLDSVKNGGYQIYQVREYLTVGWYWTASGQICTDNILPRYCFD